MRINNKNICQIAFAVLFIVGLCEGCKKRNLHLIEPFIGFKFSDTVIEENFFKAEYSPDYIRPYNVYGKYKISSKELENILKNNELTNRSQDYKKIMCMENVSVHAFPYDIWSFKTRFDYLSRKDFAIKLKWWNPSQDTEMLYAAFYREKGPRKIIRCYKDKWDGRILISYDKKTEEAYIMIEVLL